VKKENIKMVLNLCEQMQANATSSKMDIYIDYIQNGKHGSDTGSYDTEGR
jgi:hypothetical protein